MIKVTGEGGYHFAFSSTLLRVHDHRFSSYLLLSILNMHLLYICKSLLRDGFSQTMLLRIICIFEILRNTVVECTTSH